MSAFGAPVMVRVDGHCEARQGDKDKDKDSSPIRPLAQ